MAIDFTRIKEHLPLLSYTTLIMGFVHKVFNNTSWRTAEIAYTVKLPEPVGPVLVRRFCAPVHEHNPPAVFRLFGPDELVDG